MEVTLEGSNSAETLPPWDGGTRLHRPSTGDLAVRLCNLCFLFLFSYYGIFIIVHKVGRKCIKLPVMCLHNLRPVTESICTWYTITVKKTRQDNTV